MFSRAGHGHHEVHTSARRNCCRAGLSCNNIVDSATTPHATTPCEVLRCLQKWGDETPHLRTDSARVRSTPRALHRRTQKPRKTRYTATPCTRTPCGVQQHRGLRDDSARDDSMQSHPMPAKNGAMRRPISARTPPESARLRENSTSDHKTSQKTVQRRLRARRLRAESSETHKTRVGETPLSARTPLDSAKTPPPITETSQTRTSSRDGGVRSRAESSGQCPGGL